MRFASWVFVLCAALAAAGVFLPSLELRVHDAAISKRTALSLYRIASDRETARRLLAIYRGSAKRRVGAQILHAVLPRIGGRTHAALEDARDAMAALDEVSNDDARNAGRALVGALAALIGLEVLAAALVFGELVRGFPRRGRHAWVLVLAVLAAVVAIALHVACRVVAWQANDEVGAAILALGPGAYLTPIAALGAVALAIALVGRRHAPPR